MQVPRAASTDVYLHVATAVDVAAGVDSSVSRSPLVGDVGTPSACIDPAAAARLRQRWLAVYSMMPPTDDDNDLQTIVVRAWHRS